MELYGRAVKNGAARNSNKNAAAGTGSTTDLSKMSPLEKKKEIARRKAQAQKEKVQARTSRAVERVKANTLSDDPQLTPSFYPFGTQSDFLY